ncbi:SDR family NAD(P)-dependent oxidoreductase [Aminobacter sp. BE322]|uniref:SDR family NAD(P)-dependent oxidoreductase n=1 Tax=unclassified Aminobacter TaxID=2644704 RepID=UPI003D23A04F
MLLKDRIAVVTGAGSGIGRAGALMMGREGAVVVVADRDATSGDAAAEAIRAAGGRAEAICTDVSDDGQIERMIGTTLERHGRIDILHNHAGIQVGGPLTEVASEGMDASWRINVRAHFLASKLAMPAMIAQGNGVIVNTASNSGVFYDHEMIAYATSKHAVVAMTRQMSIDYAKYNVRVNALCPGWVDTPFNDPFIAQMGGRQAIEDYVRTKIPMQRWAMADEIAEAILFLVSDRSSFMTGQALVIDGGESIA